MNEAELAQLTPRTHEYVTQPVTLDGVTKPLHVWADERGLTIKIIRERRKRNSWAESLEAGCLKSKNLRKMLIQNKDTETRTKRW